MRGFLSVFLMIMSTQVKALDLTPYDKLQLIQAIEQLENVDEAFFHYALMDARNREIKNKDLGIFFNKDWFEKEDKEFFRERAKQVCDVIYINHPIEYNTSISVYFYQRALFRQYNGEAKASCRFNKNMTKNEVWVHTRAERILEDFTKGIGLVFNWLAAP
jgi:hypothetical protein